MLHPALIDHPILMQNRMIVVVFDSMTLQAFRRSLPLLASAAAMVLAGCSTRYQEGPCAAPPGIGSVGDWSLVKEVCFRYPVNPVVRALNNLFGSAQSKSIAPESTQLWIKPASIVRDGSGLSVVFLQRAVYDRNAGQFEPEAVRIKRAQINCSNQTFLDRKGLSVPINEWKRPDERFFIGGETVVKKSPLNPYKYLSETYCKA